MSVDGVNRKFSLDYVKVLHEAYNFTTVLTKNGRLSKLFQCSSCPKTFNKRHKFINHSTKHITSRNFQCSICDKMFKTNETLLQHIKNHGEKTFTCEVCEQSYISKRKLEEHQKRLPPPTQCASCNKKFHHASEMERHVILDHERDYCCYICQGKFNDSETLKKHIIQHNTSDSKAPTECQCELCGKAFPTFYAKQIHFRRQHLDKDRKICDFCGKSISSWEGLRNHILLHTSEKRHSCEYCGRTFSKRNNLTVHLRIHTKERPYECQICSKRFNQLSAMKIHIRTHTGESPYKCQFCPSAFITRTVLNKHLRNKHADRNDDTD